MLDYRSVSQLLLQAMWTVTKKNMIHIDSTCTWLCWGPMVPHWSIVSPYVPWSKVAILGMVIPPFNRNPYNGYINPYYWVDDHPLLYGNNGSLDPGTYWPFKKKCSESLSNRFYLNRSSPRFCCHCSCIQIQVIRYTIQIQKHDKQKSSHESLTCKKFQYGHVWTKLMSSWSLAKKTKQCTKSREFPCLSPENFAGSYQTAPCRAIRIRIRSSTV